MALGGAGIGTIAGGIVGGVSGLAGSAAMNRQNARNRRSFRRAVRAGRARTEKEVWDVLNSPEYQAVRQFALGTFGIDVGQLGPGGGISFGGRTYGGAPTGFALEGKAKKQAGYLGRDLGNVLQAQQQLESGLDMRGRPLSDAQKAKLERQVAQGENLYKAFQAGTEDFQQGVITRLGKKGFTEAQAAAAFGGVTQTAGGPVPTGGPVSVETGGMENIQTSGAVAPGYGGVEGFGLTSPLARDFVKGIGQAQTSRGLYSSHAAAAAEASGLAAFNFEQQKQLLPFLLGLSTFGSDYARGARQANIAEQVQLTSGGTAMYGAVNPFGNQPVIAGGAQGALAGAGAGAAIGATIGGGGGGGGANAGYQSPYSGAQPNYGNPYQNYQYPPPENPY